MDQGYGMKGGEARQWGSSNDQKEWLLSAHYPTLRIHDSQTVQ